jgi:single-strand DNA-binding protein
MSGSLNKVMLIGNLGADPDLRFTTGGNAVCNMSLATNESWVDARGVKQERTEWHRIVCWGAQAKNHSKYLGKGRQVFIEGKLQTRKWQDKAGNDRYTTEIIGLNVQYLGGNGQKQSFSSEEPPVPSDTETGEIVDPVTSGDFNDGLGDEFPG